MRSGRPWHAARASCWMSFSARAETPAPSLIIAAARPTAAATPAAHLGIVTIIASVAEVAGVTEVAEVVVSSTMAALGDHRQQLAHVLSVACCAHGRAGLRRCIGGQHFKAPLTISTVVFV